MSTEVVGFSYDARLLSLILLPVPQHLLGGGTVSSVELPKFPTIDDARAWAALDYCVHRLVRLQLLAASLTSILNQPYKGDRCCTQFCYC